MEKCCVCQKIGRSVSRICGLNRCMIRLFWWQIARAARRHRLLVLCNVLSLALGIAVYLAIRIANDSATRAFSATVDLVAGRAHLEVRGDVDETIWPVLEKQPEVEAVTGIVEALATLPGKPGEYLRLTGVDVITGLPFQRFDLKADAGAYDAGRWLATPGGVAISKEFATLHSLTIGSELPVLVNSRPKTLTVLAVVSGSDIPVDARFAVMDLGWIQELLERPGKLSAVQLRIRDPERADQVARRLEQAVPGYQVSPPRERSAQVGKMLAAFQLNLTALSMVSLLVGVFLVFNTVSTSVARRRQQIGIIRALGVTPAMARCLFLGEALFYAIPGVLIGAAGGVLLATKLTGAVEHSVTSLYALVSVDQLVLIPGQFGIAAVYGVLAALAGAWQPASEAARVEPVDALRRAVGEKRASSGARRWWLAGIAFLAGAAVCGWAALSGAPPWLAFGAAFLVLVSSAAFAPLVLSLCAGLARWFPATLPAIRIAGRRMSLRLRRNAITVAALASAVAMFIALAVMVHSFRQSLDAWIGKGIVADLFIAPAANEVLGINSYLPAEAPQWLRQRPEVAAADTIREQSASVLIHGRAETALLTVVDGEYRENLTLLEGEMKATFRGEAVAITEALARHHHLKVGETMGFEGPLGKVVAPVAAIYSDYSRDQGVILMSLRQFARLRDDRRVHTAAVFLKPGADAAHLQSDFNAAFPGEWSIKTSRTLRERILKIFDQTFAITMVLRSVAVVVAIAGVLLTMLTMVVERRRELALMRALGGTPGFVARVVVSEAAMLGLISAVLGVVTGLPLAMVLTWVVNPAFFGWTIHFQVPWEVLAWTPLWITLVAIGAASWPARQARRIGAAEALHEE